MGGKRKKFDAILGDLRRDIQCPELVDAEECATSMKSLKSYYKELRRIRTEATKGFNEYTRAQDTYIDQIYAEYLDIRQNVNKLIPGVQELIEPQKMVTCGKCASAAMPANELAEHERQYHPETFLPPIAPRTLKIQPPGYHTAGSYKAPFSKREQYSDTDSTESRGSSKGFTKTYSSIQTQSLQ